MHSISIQVQKIDKNTLNNHINKTKNKKQNNKCFTYNRYQSLKRLQKNLFQQNKSTALIGMGCNPGIISHFTMAAIQHAFNHTFTNSNNHNNNNNNNNNNMSIREMGIRWGLNEIRIMERDTQTSIVMDEKDEFVNPWVTRCIN